MPRCGLTTQGRSRSTSCRAAGVLRSRRPSGQISLLHLVPISSGYAADLKARSSCLKVTTAGFCRISCRIRLREVTAITSPDADASAALERLGVAVRDATTALALTDNLAPADAFRVVAN